MILSLFLDRNYFLRFKLLVKLLIGIITNVYYFSKRLINLNDTLKMKKSPLRILLVGIFNEKGKELIPILKKNDYIVDTAEGMELAVQRITNEEADLVISSKKLNGFHGFEVYNQLKPNLFNAGIPFFMVLDEFEKNDVLIGLEMGIDNFLFSPFVEPIVIHAIENWLKKKNGFNLFESDAFKHYFYTTSVAMFFTSKGAISMVNEAFCRSIDMCGNQLLGTSVEELFFMEDNEINKLNYRRFKSGVTDECYLKNVKWINKQTLHFDITFYRGKSKGTNDVFVELVTPFLPLKNTDSAVSHKDQNTVEGINPETKKDFKCEVRLTEREKQVYILSAQGMALKQIASELNLSQRTVEKHRANIMQKTKTSNFIETMMKIGQLNN